MPARSLHMPDNLGISQHLLAPFYSHTRRPTQSGLMSLRKLTALIRAGYGQGHRERYQPWLRVQKRDLSPVSPMGHLPSPEFGHTHHYRSRLERSTLILLKWMQPYDARDQYPAWPWEHRHPLHGLPGWNSAPLVEGISGLARRADVAFRTSVNRTVPTLDILVTWRSTEGVFWLAAYDCKPTGLIEGAAGWQSLERLELLGLYAQTIDAHHHIVTDLSEHAQLLVNLDSLRPRESYAARQKVRGTDVYKELVDACYRRAYRQPLHRVVEAYARKVGMNLLIAHRLVDIALWDQDIDHDLSRPREPWMPLVPGGRALRRRLKEQWGGNAP